MITSYKRRRVDDIDDDDDAFCRRRYDEGRKEQSRVPISFVGLPRV